MRCSRDGEPEGDGSSACSGEKNAMIAMKKKTRIFTRSRYSAGIYPGKKNA